MNEACRILTSRARASPAAIVFFGGELASYTDLLQESRDEAVERMLEQAKSIGANAVINVRFSTSAIAAGASEILAYGTAVLVEET